MPSTKGIWTGALALALLAAAGPALAATPQPYNDEDKGFTITFPAGWRVGAVATFQMVTVASAPKEGPKDPYRENIKVAAVDLPPGVTLADYVKNSVAAQHRVWTVREVGALTLTGRPARQLVVDQKFDGELTRVLKTFVEDHGRVYVLSCSAEPAAFGRYRPVFEQAITSFKPRHQALLADKKVYETSAFSCTYPRPFSIYMRDDNGGVTLARKLPQGTAVIRIAIKDAPDASEDALRAAFEAGKRYWTSKARQHVVREERVTVAGAPAFRLTSVFRDAVVRKYAHHVTMAHAGKLVIVSYKLPPAAGTQERPRELDEILASWKWR